MAEKEVLIGILLIHSLETGIGGMETHQRAFINHYVNKQESKYVSFRYIVENANNIITLHEFNSIGLETINNFSNLHELIDYLNKHINFNVIFLNDGWWIESIITFRIHYPSCFILMRSGGNDIELAPWNVGTFSYKERRELWKNSINQLDGIIANSNYSVSLMHRLGIKHTKIYKIRGGVDENKCAEYRNKKTDLKLKLIHKLGIKQKYIIIFACRFVPFKGITQALKSLKLSLLFEDSHILFVGSGQLRYEIEEWCVTNLKTDQYNFLGELASEQVIQTIAASDILVNTSLNYHKSSGDGQYIHTETMGRSMMEAVCVRTLIIATDVGGTNELFSENKHIGIICSPNETSIISAFNSIRKMKYNQIEQLHNYSWSYIFNCYDQIINSFWHEKQNNI